MTTPQTTQHARDQALRQLLEHRLGLVLFSQARLNGLTPNDRKESTA